MYIKWNYNTPFYLIELIPVHGSYTSIQPYWGVEEVSGVYLTFNALWGTRVTKTKQLWELSHEVKKDFGSKYQEYM